MFGAIDYVAERGIPVERIGLLGFSLGAGVAILVAARESRVLAIVSDTGFLDYVIDLRQLSVGTFRLPSWFAIFVALAGRTFFRADFSADFSKVRPVQVVEGISQPIFFIHGEDDPVISAEETLELHIVSDNREDRVWIVAGTEQVNVYRRMRKITSTGSLSFSGATSPEPSGAHVSSLGGANSWNKKSGWGQSMAATL